MLAAAVALAAVVAGCGGGASSAHTQSTHPSSASATRSATGSATGSSGGSSSAPRAMTGPEVFAHDCVYCHSISGHSKPSQQGGDLLHYHASRAQMLQLTAEMPVEHRPLTRSELRAVVDYVLGVERRG